MKNVTFFDHSV